MKIILIKIRDTWTQPIYRRYHTPVFTEFVLFTSNKAFSIILRLDPRAVHPHTSIPILIQKSKRIHPSFVKLIVQNFPTFFDIVNNTTFARAQIPLIPILFNSRCTLLLRILSHSPLRASLPRKNFFLPFPSFMA